MKTVWLFLLVAYSGLIFYLSNQPSLPVPGLFLHQDKLFHAAAYGVLGLLAFNYFRYWSIERSVVLMLSFGFCAIYGASDEWHQSFIAGRDADVFDWLADCVGAAIVLICCYRFQVLNVHPNKPLSS